jgi:hypothetical protein
VAAINQGVLGDSSTRHAAYARLQGELRAVHAIPTTQIAEIVWVVRTLTRGMAMSCLELNHSWLVIMHGVPDCGRVLQGFRVIILHRLCYRRQRS